MNALHGLVNRRAKVLARFGNDSLRNGAVENIAFPLYAPIVPKAVF